MLLIQADMSVWYQSGPRKVQARTSHRFRVKTCIICQPPPAYIGYVLQLRRDTTCFTSTHHQCFVHELLDPIIL